MEIQPKPTDSARLAPEAWRLYYRAIERYPKLSDSQRKGLIGELRGYCQLKGRLRKMFPYPFTCPKIIYDPVNGFMSRKPDLALKLGKLTVLIEVKDWHFKITPDDISNFIACKDWRVTGRVLKVFLNIQANEASQSVLTTLKTLGILYADGVTKLLSTLSNLQEASIGLCRTDTNYGCNGAIDGCNVLVNLGSSDFSSSCCEPPRLGGLEFGADGLRGGTYRGSGLNPFTGMNWGVKAVIR